MVNKLLSEALDKLLSETLELNRMREKVRHLEESLRVSESLREQYLDRLTHYHNEKLRDVQAKSKEATP
jgi:hypothetical protein